MRVLHFSFRMLLLIAASILAISLLPFNVNGQDSGLGTNDSCLDEDYSKQLNTVYRRWHSGLIDHFYTNNPNEVGSGYQVESSGWGVIAQQQQATVPLYRYWSSSLSDHFYSTSAQTPGGYVSEGIIGYVFPNNVPGSVPLYRYYRHINSSPANGDHLYTISDERNSVGQHGYREEGIEAYVCAVPLVST